MVGKRQTDSRYCSFLPYDGVVGGHHTGPRAGQKTVRGRWGGLDRSSRSETELRTVPVDGKDRRKTYPDQLLH
jgi:hypothetical protein